MDEVVWEPDAYDFVLSKPNAAAQELDALREGTTNAFKHVVTPFHWCGLTSQQEKAVYWHVRRKSHREVGELIGLTRNTVRQYLLQAVDKINKAEDWEIKIADLADVLFRLIKEELDGSETGTSTGK